MSAVVKPATTNTCDLQYKLSTNKRLLVEICLMQVSSINFLEQSKKKNKNFVVSSKNDNTSWWIQRDYI